MNRRAFIFGIAGAAAIARRGAAMPRRAEAARRIGVLSTSREGEQEAGLRTAVLQESLRQMGWVKGQNLEIEYRCTGPDIARAGPFAAELAGIGSELIFAIGTHAVSAIEAAAPGLPMVFSLIQEPLDDRVVSRLMRRDGNSAGFADFEFSIARGWVDILEKCVPHLKRMTLIADPEICNFAYMQTMLASAVKSRALQAATEPVQSAADIERVLAPFSREPDGGLIVLLDESKPCFRDPVIAVAARYRLPAIYCNPQFPRSGGLISYCVDFADIYRRCALYIDRILRGTKAGNLQLESPTKCMLTVNLGTAASLGIAVPHALLELADEIIG